MIGVTSRGATPDFADYPAVGHTGKLPLAYGTATFIGPAERYPGFKYGELKPYSQPGFDEFMKQLHNWGLPSGETQLWFYNGGGIIGTSGINF